MVEPIIWRKNVPPSVKRIMSVRATRREFPCFSDSLGIQVCRRNYYCSVAREDIPVYLSWKYKCGFRDIHETVMNVDLGFPDWQLSHLRMPFTKQMNWRLDKKKKTRTSLLSIKLKWFCFASPRLSTSLLASLTVTKLVIEASCRTIVTIPQHDRTTHQIMSSAKTTHPPSFFILSPPFGTLTRKKNAFLVRDKAISCTLYLSIDAACS